MGPSVGKVRIRAKAELHQPVLAHEAGGKIRSVK
jgi:hypothetical protein